MSRRFNKDDFDRLNERLTAVVRHGEVAEKKHSLIYLFLSHRYYCDKATVAEAITDGGNDCGIDAVYIDRRGDDPAVHIIQSKVHESERKAKNPFPFSSVEKISRFFEILTSRQADLPKIVNPRLEQKVLEIRELIRHEFPSFRVWLLSNGMPASRPDIAPMEAALKRHDADLEEFHLDEVVEFCLNKHSSRTSHTFYARDTGVLDYGNSNLYSIVGYISAHQLYLLLKDLRDERKLDYSVFDMNVRGFLGLDNPVNKEIFKSATMPANENFAAFNNGITMVGSQCKVSRTSVDGPRIGVKRLSIVNGAQTCSAIFDAMSAYYPDVRRFDRLSVLFRVFQTEDPDLIAQIALSTNNQSRISPRDLRSNDDIQRKLEADLRALGILYLRKRGFVDESFGDMKPLDALRAGQLLLTYRCHDPVRAKRDSDSIFSDLYNVVFAQVSAEELIDALDWFERIEERRKFVVDEVRIRGAHRVDHTFLTYGSFHVLMLCSLLAPNASGKEREAVIDQAIQIVASYLGEVGNPAYYTFFRDNRHAEALKKMAVEPRLI